MKKILFAVAMLMISDRVCAETFGHPSAWGVPEDDHYNTYIEDQNRACYVMPEGKFRGKCDDSSGYTSKDYVKRDCGYGGHCSSDDKYHSGVDYDFPNHNHDPEDYIDGTRKDTDIRQGTGVELTCSDKEDEIVASGYGKVVRVEDKGGTEKKHGWGRNIIIRHICDPSDPKSKELCVKENIEGVSKMVIYTQYSHLSQFLVTEGSIVKKGQKIGIIGGTGGWIDHLHFEFKTKNDIKSPDCNYQGYVVSKKDAIYDTLYKCGYRNPADFIGKVSVEPQQFTPAETESPFRCVLNDDICWSPSDSSCINSQLLIYKGVKYYNDGMLRMFFACSKAYNDAVSEGLSESYWRSVFLGHNGIFSIGMCRQ